jgi:hypothetical protein
MVKNSEETLDRLLTGLRTAKPPAGMNQRIMAALHNQSTERTHATPDSFRLVWLSAPVAVVVLASVVIFHTAHRQTHAPTQTAQPSAKEVPATSPSLVNAQTTRPLLYQEPKPRATMRLVSKPGSKTSTTAQDMDALAEEEMRAASQPAPRLPLSNQEKLLLRMTHKRTPIELAALSPATRAQHDAEEQADFEKFFEPPKPPVDSE